MESEDTMEEPLLVLEEEAVVLSVEVPSEAKKGRSNYSRTWVNITKCFVGAASFELPWAFSKGGLVGSVVGLKVLAVLSAYSLKRLVACSALSKEGARTYPHLMREAFGPAGFAVAWFGVMTMTLGVCGSYFVFISQTVAELTGCSVNSALAGTLTVVGVLSWLKQLKTIAWTSLLGVSALVLAVGVVSFHALEPRESAVALIDLDRFNGGTYGLFLGNAGFLYLISTAVLPLAQDAERAQDFAPALDSSVVWVTVVNLAFGVLAWSRYGDTLQGNVVDNLPKDALLTVVVKVLLVVDLTFTGVIYLYPVNEALEADLQVRSECRRRVQRFAFVVAVAYVAHVCPSFELLTGLTGGLGNNILGFVLPPLLYLQLAKNNDIPVPTRERATLALICAFGLFFLVYSTTSFARSIHDRHKRS